MHELALDGLKVRYLRAGSLREEGDLPVLVLHGWAAHLEAIAPITDALAAETEVLALDLPGCGESDPPPAPWGVEDYVRHVLGFLDELGVERAHVVGHSHGGRVAIAMASDHPERVGRLLLCDAAGIPPKRGLAYHRRVALAKLGRVVGAVGGGPGRRLQERMRRRVASTDYLEASEAMRGTFRKVIAADLTDHLARVKSSALLVWGEDDDDTPVWMAERMKELLPDAGLVVLPGAGHYSYADQPGRFNQVARVYLCEQPRQVAAQA